MANGTKHTRRDFLRTTTVASAAAIAAPYFVPAHVLGGPAGKAPSDKLGIGLIGTGGMGMGHLGWITSQPDLVTRAVCDVDKGHLQRAVDAAKATDNGKECKGFADFQELLAQPGIDAVWVVTPDHWHSLITIAAAKAGKDIYCQKPLANSIGEGRAMVDAVKKYERVMQCGSQERSTPTVRYACELVRNGKLGEIKTIQIYLPCEENHHNEARSRQGKLVPADVPPELDYDFWLGHTEEVPYAENRCHFWWRFNSRYGAGEMTDRGAHVIDIAQLALDMDNSGPVEYRAQGVPLQGGLYDAFMDFTFENVYPNGVRMIGHKTGPRGIRFEGTDGSLFVHIHGGKLEADPVSLLDTKFGDGDIQLGRTSDHQRNFIDCVRSREVPFAGGEVGHRTATLCQLNVIAMRLGRPLAWDPVAERIVDDEEANKYLLPKMRAPWTLS
jgi:predicted dehydrogenase